MNKTTQLTALCAVLCACSGEDATTFADVPLDEGSGVGEVLAWPDDVPRKPGMFRVIESHGPDGHATTILDHEGNVVEDWEEVMGADEDVVEKAEVNASYGVDEDGERCSSSSTRCVMPAFTTSGWEYIDDDLTWEIAENSDAFVGSGRALAHARNDTAFHNFWSPNGVGQSGNWELHLSKDPPAGAPATLHGRREHTRDCSFYGTANGINYCRSFDNRLTLYTDNIRTSAAGCPGRNSTDVFEVVALHEIGHALGLGHWAGNNPSDPTAMKSGDYCNKPDSFNPTELNDLANYDPGGFSVTINP